MTKRSTFWSNFKLLGKCAGISLLTIGVFSTLSNNESLLKKTADSNQSKKLFQLPKNNHLYVSGLKSSSNLATQQNAVASYYRQVLGKGEELLSNLSLRRDEKMKLVSRLYGLIKKEEIDESLIGSFFTQGFKDVENLMVEAQERFRKGELNKGQNQLGYLSSLLEVLNEVREKFSDSLRDYSGTSETEIEDIKTLALLVRIGMNIMSYYNWLIRITYAYSNGNYTLTKKRIEEIHKLSESVEADENYHQKRVEKIADWSTRLDLRSDMWSAGSRIINLDLAFYVLEEGK